MVASGHDELNDDLLKDQLNDDQLWGQSITAVMHIEAVTSGDKWS